MKTDAPTTAQAETSPASVEQAEGHHDDPFAVDLFAAHRPGAAAAPETTARQEEIGPIISEARPPWYASLPRCSSEQARLSSALGLSLPGFDRAAVGVLSSILSRYLRVADDELSLAAIDVRERELARSEAASQTGARQWATLSIAHTEGRLACELDGEFAAALVDRILGGKGRPPESLRQLSRTEQAVIEFLWLSVVRAVNRESGEPFWRLEALTAQPPAWLTGSEAGRGIVATFRLSAGALLGVLRVYLTRDALAALASVPRTLFSGADETSARLSRLKRVSAAVTLHPVAGSTELTAAELVQLEPGDVVLVQRPFARLRREGGGLTGRLEVRIGDGERAAFSGTIRQAGESLSLLVEIIEGGETPSAGERLMMEEDEARADEESADAIALEDVQLTVHVELAQRRLSLDELSRLRVGQLLELGCKPTDPVELVADGRRIARGELVLIEDRLGVRLTQLAGFGEPGR